MATTRDAQPVALDGVSLTVADLAAIAHRAPVDISDHAIAGLDLARDRLIAAREAGAVYGANTGVGANRGVRVSSDHNPKASAAHGKRLLRSHCAGVGSIENDPTARAAMVVRLNQLLAGGSGVSSAVGAGLAEAIMTGSVPTLHRLGSIGTSDLAALAELALTLSGERPWRVGGIEPVALADSDALPFMSSSAVTLATAALAVQDLKALMDSGTVVAALSFLALNGSSEAYDEAVQAARPHRHQAEVARLLCGLVGPARVAGVRPARLQDPFGLRVIPQVHAPAVGALADLIAVIETEINAASENPLVLADGVRHHGQFHLGTLASALDSARTSIYPVFTLSAARLGLLHRTDMTGLAPFLADDVPGSSGLMIAEYIVQDVLASLRVAATPVSGASVSISLGMEEHASFATQGARLLRDVAAAAPTVFAVEAVAAVRALRLSPERLQNAPARAAYDLLAAELSADIADRPLGEDIERTVDLLPALGRFVSNSL